MKLRRNNVSNRVEMEDGNILLQEKPRQSFSGFRKSISVVSDRVKVEKDKRRLTKNKKKFKKFEKKISKEQKKTSGSRAKLFKTCTSYLRHKITNCSISFLNVQHQRELKAVGFL